jgi:hypothetical protein
MNTRTLASTGKRTVDAVKTTSTTTKKNYPTPETEPLLSDTEPSQSTTTPSSPIEPKKTGWFGM